MYHRRFHAGSVNTQLEMLEWCKVAPRFVHWYIIYKSLFLGSYCVTLAHLRALDRQ